LQKIHEPEPLNAQAHYCDARSLFISSNSSVKILYNITIHVKLLGYHLAVKRQFWRIQTFTCLILMS